jgi:hypothetical protein
MSKNCKHCTGKPLNYPLPILLQSVVVCETVLEEVEIMTGKKGGGKRGRSSITGKFVTTKYAKSHPKTTEIERVKSPSRKGGKRSTASANDLMREAWEYTYANRNRRLD